MELLYVWVESYGNIKKQGFNFSPNYDFEYNPETKELKCEKRMKQPKGFFGEKISNITTIVGKNGSGKTTLLEFLLQIDTYNERLGNKNSLIIFQIEGEIVYEKYKVKINNESKLVIKENKKENDKYFRDAKKNNFVRKFYFDDINISNDWDNSVINPNKYRRMIGENPYIETKMKSANELLTNKTINRIKFFMSLEKIDFLKNNKDLNTYNKIDSIFIGKSNFKYVEEKWRKNQENNNVKKIDTIYRQLAKKIREEYIGRGKTRAIRDIELIKENTLDYIFSNLIDYVKTKDNVEVIESIGQEQFDIELSKFIETFKRDNKVENDVYLDYFKPLVAAIEDENSISFKYEGVDYKALKNYNGIIFDKKIIEVLAKNLDFYNFRLIAEQFKIDYFPFLSKGEECLLDIFSTFHNNKEIQNSDNVLIALDEGDMHFHPEWQRKYLNILVGYLSEVFKEKNVQIILTSHSPFVASDLPRENVIMLDTYDEKDEETKRDKEDPKYQNNGNCKVVNDTVIKTFGANIHSLLANSFFMESTLGEFAKQKITEVIKDLDLKIKENKDIEENRNKEIKYIISLIGEPVIKAKLQEMYNRAFPKEQDNLLKLIANLEDEIRQLNKDKENPKNGLDALRKLKKKIEDYEEVLKKVGDIYDTD